MCGRGRDGQAILFFTSEKFFIPKIYPPYINSVSNSLPIAQTNTSALPARLKQVNQEMLVKPLDKSINS